MGRCTIRAVRTHVCPPPTFNQIVTYILITEYTNIRYKLCLNQIVLNTMAC